MTGFDISALADLPETSGEHRAVFQLSQGTADRLRELQADQAHLRTLNRHDRRAFVAKRRKAVSK